MNSHHLHNVFVAYNVLSAILLTWTLLGLASRSSGIIVSVYPLSLIPAGLYAGVSMAAAFSNSVTGRPVGRVKSGLILHGATGILLFAWAFISYDITLKEKHKPRNYPKTWGSDMKWSTGIRVRSFFTIFTGYVFFLACMIIACVLASSGLSHPWNFSSCSDDLCRRQLTVQFMALVHILQLAAAVAMTVPVMAVPRYLSGNLFIVASYLQRLSSPLLKRQHCKHDLEKASLIAEDEKNTSLSSLFRSDAVAVALARNLHLDDVTNVSMASKSLRRAVLSPTTASKDAQARRRELLCENSCDSGVKNECWACAKVICKTCQTSYLDIPLPRTQSHIDSCFAICSRCFFLSPDDAASRPAPAPRAATWRQHDLSVQHTTHCEREMKMAVCSVSVARLCPSCAKLEPEAVRDIREMRDQASLRRMLNSRVRCRVCEVVLKASARRWWICDGGHECRWAGHEVQRS